MLCFIRRIIKIYNNYCEGLRFLHALRLVEMTGEVWRGLSTAYAVGAAQWKGGGNS